MKKENVKISYSFVKILTGSDLSRRRLPLMHAESPHPGPVVWLTACAHGDEVGGIATIQEVFKKIKAALKKGSLYAFPLMNPTGFETTSRQIVMSKEDLNRSFPGDENGSLAERIADKIFSYIESTGPELVLDLHNDWSKSIPYTLIDPDPGSGHREAYEKAKSFAAETGFLNILETEEYGYNNTLTYSLLRKNIPALALELGESYVVNEINIGYGIGSVWNILGDLGMVDTADGTFSYNLPDDVKDRVLSYTDRPFCSYSGIIRFMVRPGDMVKKGQKLARIHNAFGKHLETLTALHDGIVLGHTDYAVAFPGAKIIVFGIV
jgi:predicted deacylase